MIKKIAFFERRAVGKEVFIYYFNYVDCIVSGYKEVKVK